MLRLGVPSKGRLQEETIAWFADRGVAIERDGAGRAYRGSVRGAEGVALVLLAAAEIPRELAAGRLHLGVTGQDLVREAVPAWSERLAEMAPLGFGFADLVVAVPAAWIDVADMSDLDGAAAQFRAEHGHRLRVATKYHHLGRDFFRAHGVADYALVDSQGATEGAVKNLTAEAVADITTTGSTLRDNRLRVLEDGVILRSQATLFLSRTAPWSAPARANLADLAARLGLAVPQDHQAGGLPGPVTRRRESGPG
jgi:ATP phosphoribosyltransferase